MTEDGTRYDPRADLIQLRGKGGASDYLPVAARLRWFREESPDGQIEMEHVELTDRRAIFRATVTRIVDGEVRGRATGYGSETPADFGDYIEKASSKALGRALAALGYGTQFIGDEGERIVDSPVEAPERPAAAPTPVRGPNAPRRPAQDATGASPATGPTHRLSDAKRRRLFAAARGKLHDGDVHNLAVALHGHGSTNDLSDAEAEELAAWLGGLHPTAAGVIAEFVGQILAAADGAALAKVGQRIGAAGVADERLRAAYRRKQRAFAATE